jgi:UDP-N-acetylglucosamine diphosphorylase/glucosamine-1-phosphate N-acetyltransferase
VNTILKIPSDTALLDEEGNLIALHSEQRFNHADELTKGARHFTYTGQLSQIKQVWDIFLLNSQEIKEDFEVLTQKRTSNPMSDPHTICYNPEQIFIEEGAEIRAAVLNASSGPIYIGKNAQISEGALIQGPFALNEGSVVAQGAKIRPGTSVGPHCKVGGEINNAVFFGYSNKGHDGYLGNAVIGEWCNLGANTNNSNLKNDISHVKLYSYVNRQLENTGLTFCGLLMGDYSKAGISTMFNTGTTVGVSVNVFGAGFQKKHTPSFSWGGAAEGSEPYRLDKAIQVIKNTQFLKKVEFTSIDETILRHIHLLTQTEQAI